MQGLDAILPDGPELIWGFVGFVLLAVLVAVVVALLVGFLARRTVRDPARQRQLSGGAVGVVLVVFVLAALTPLTGAPAAGVLGALPNIVAAVLLVVLGLALGPVARALTHRGLERFRPGLADVVAPLVAWLVYGLAFLLAADQLGIETRLVQQLVALVVGGLALAMALALGLGTRELVAAVVAGRHVAQIVAVGDRVEVSGLQGTIVALGHASVRLTADPGEVEVPNGRFLDGTVVVLERASAVDTAPLPERPHQP